MSENETKQPSAGEVLTLVALMVEAKYEADTLPEGSDQRRARFTEYVNYEHRLRQFDPAHLRTLAAAQQPTEREALERQIREALERNWQAWPFATPHGVAGYLATALCPPAEEGEAQ